MVKPTLCVDFDGVIHSYTSPWVDEVTILDPPVPGAIEWLAAALEFFVLVIYSSRSRSREGRKAMLSYIVGHARKVLPPDHPMTTFRTTTTGDPDLMGDYPIKFAAEKPAAFLTIDDRALLFMGSWSDLDPRELLKFKPWNKVASAEVIVAGLKRINQLRECTAVASSPGNADVNGYMYGMANGFILALNIMEGMPGSEPPYLQFDRYTEKRWKPMHSAPKDRPIAIITVQPVHSYTISEKRVPRQDVVDVIEGHHVGIDVVQWRGGDDGACFVLGHNTDSKVGHACATAWCEVAELEIADLLAMTDAQLEELAHGLPKEPELSIAKDD